VSKVLVYTNSFSDYTSGSLLMKLTPLINNDILIARLDIQMCL